MLGPYKTSEREHSRLAVDRFGELGVAWSAAMLEEAAGGEEFGVSQGRATI
jgi:hypothetical protein